MSNLTRIGALAFVLSSIACGGTSETISSTDPIGTESEALARDPACPKKAPVAGTGCDPDHLSCLYHTDDCPHGSTTEFQCESNGSNLAWTVARCTPHH